MSGLVLVSATSVLDSTRPKTAPVACPAGTRALGGGASLAGAGTTAVALQTTAPTVDGGGNPNGWTAQARELSNTNSTWTVTAVALCAVVS